MRQAGVIAAAGLYALDHNMARLSDDHANAQLLAEHLQAIPGITLLSPSIQTNLVFFDVSGTGLSAEALAERLLARGIRIGAVGPHHMRAVTHLDVSCDDVMEAADIVKAVIAAQA
jgi:threonine aldolase